MVPPNIIPKPRHATIYKQYPVQNHSYAVSALSRQFQNPNINGVYKTVPTAATLGIFLNNLER